ncbi:hypothetical protein JR316_0007252 [Psilocybe cubensis]|uniref:Uncharacterized protein n=1 Tax=Psilocybe cubensis TaxID=181762 RepID=A0ACB8GYZ6_PSICU|nr:hypothetical protein JR316_0007252 [Psilocybe cubensis]KAH9480652.1 hypothetical protein JR316_0007252 [Psilocybe cubensis]
MPYTTDTRERKLSLASFLNPKHFYGEYMRMHASKRAAHAQTASLPHSHHLQQQLQLQHQPPPPPLPQQTVPSRHSNAASAFGDFGGLRRRRSTGGGTKVRSGKEKGKGEKEKDRDRDAGVASSSSTGSASATTKEAKERSRLSGLGISSSSVVYSTSIGSGNSISSDHNGLHTPTSPVASTSSTHLGMGSSSTSGASGGGGGEAGRHGNNASSTSIPSAIAASSSSASSSHHNAHAQPHPHAHPHPHSQTAGSSSGDPRFSTADRTVLAGIREGQQAMERQFVIKGVGHNVIGGGRSAGKRYHPFSRREVPYPRSYDREVVDFLEIGCGLDIVPLHPNLQNLGSSDLASRITWVQHNFLETLPFQDEEFDFVHIKRIALGVPEDRWDKFFEEIQRVMKPGGAFEMVEEDLFFPGSKPLDEDDVSVASLHGGDDASSVTRRDSVSSDEHRTLNGFDGPERLPRVSEGDSPVTPTSALVAPSSQLPLHVPSRPSTPTRNQQHGSGDAKEVADAQALAPPSPPRDSQPEVVRLVTPHSRSLVRPPLSVKTHKTQAAAASASAADAAAAAAAPPAYYGSSLGGMGYVTSQDPAVDFIKDQRRAAAQAARKQAIESSPPPPQPKPKPPTLLTKDVTPPPANPRDHTMLEAIWNGMLESRFVNTTPLSLLTTYLEYHFKDVRTHPPLLYTFPPLPDKPDDEDEDEAQTPHQLPSDSETDMDDSRDSSVPKPSKARSTKSRKSVNSNNTAHPEDINLEALYAKQSPYVTLDGSRSFAFSPAMRAAFTPVKEGQQPPLRRMSRLPNPVLNIDLRTLNLHLHLRAREIIACSESMWEWVLERQAAAEKEAAQAGRFRSGSASIEEYMVGVQATASNSSVNLTQSAILEMTRDDFDHLLVNFEMDMHDKASVSHALEERFNWNVFRSPILQDRKAFDNACEKYDKHIAKQKRDQMATNPYRQSNSHRSRNSMSTPGLVQPMSELLNANDLNMIARSTSSPQPSSGDRSLDDTSSIATAIVSNTRQDSNSSHTHLGSSSTSQLSEARPPQMLSRAMRVFVAWKAS